jgi:hypothetical protein
MSVKIRDRCQVNSLPVDSGHRYKHKVTIKIYTNTTIGLMKIKSDKGMTRNLNKRRIQQQQVTRITGRMSLNEVVENATS